MLGPRTAHSACHTQKESKGRTRLRRIVTSMGTPFRSREYLPPSRTCGGGWGGKRQRCARPRAGMLCGPAHFDHPRCRIILPDLPFPPSVVLFQPNVDFFANVRNPRIRRVGRSGTYAFEVDPLRRLVPAQVGDFYPQVPDFEDQRWIPLAQLIVIVGEVDLDNSRLRGGPRHARRTSACAARCVQHDGKGGRVASASAGRTPRRG